MTRRTVGTMIVFVSILTLPYWIYIPVLFIAIALLPFFWEGILFAFLIDTIYGSGGGNIFQLISPLTISILITLVVLVPFRESLRSYV